jgi:hypothetical protein
VSTITYPGCDACDPLSLDCTPACPDGVPKNLILTVSGYDTHMCVDCPNLNGTFLLAGVDGEGSGAGFSCVCFWTATAVSLAACIGGGVSWQLLFACDGSGWELTYGSGSHPPAITAAQGTGVICDGNLDLSPFQLGGDIYCDGTGLTLLLSPASPVTSPCCTSKIPAILHLTITYPDSDCDCFGGSTPLVHNALTGFWTANVNCNSPSFDSEYLIRAYCVFVDGTNVQWFVVFDHDGSVDVGDLPQGNGTCNPLFVSGSGHCKTPGLPCDGVRANWALTE